MTEWWDGTGVTIQALKAEVIKLGTEFPDNTMACTYSTDEGEPVCIVGRAVYNITGKPVNNSAWFGQLNEAHGTWVKALGGDINKVDLGFSQEDLRAFYFVKFTQGRQDRGESWGDSLEYARRFASGS